MRHLREVSFLKFFIPLLLNEAVLLGEKKKKKEEKHSKFEKLKKDDITEKNYNQQLQYI